MLLLSLDKYTLKEGENLNKNDIAKELTIAALNNKYIISNASDRTSTVSMSESVAENVAAFYNKLIEKLDIKEVE
jgi:hypothetical protein